jgi:DNA-binding NarL/FixJ family response regulator
METIYTENNMTESAPHPAREQKKVRVLLVDDHAVLRQCLAAMINAEPDMVVCGEADGVRAAMVAADACRPDVAVVDLSINDGDGLELIRSLRDRRSAVATLVLSMHDESIYAERSLRAGARGYVMKDQAYKNVLIGIRAILRGERYFSPDIAGPPGSDEDAVGCGLARLSDRELQVLRCVGNGLSTREISEELFISVKTVETHREHIKQKLDLAASGDLLRFAIEHNRISG